MRRNNLSTTKVIDVLVVLFSVLLLVCVLAPWLGTNTSDARSEKAHPQNGWFPPLVRR
jgi:hypothetical protein